jgi:hypothetical protein
VRPGSESSRSLTYSVADVLFDDGTEEGAETPAPSGLLWPLLALPVVLLRLLRLLLLVVLLLCVGSIIVAATAGEVREATGRAEAYVTATVDVWRLRLRFEFACAVGFAAALFDFALEWEVDFAGMVPVGVFAGVRARVSECSSVCECT